VPRDFVAESSPSFYVKEKSLDDSGIELSKSKQVDNPIESNFSINKTEDSFITLTPVFGWEMACF